MKKPLALMLLSMVAASCAPTMDEIDRETERLIGHTSTNMLASPPPVRDASYDDPTGREKDDPAPGTANLEASSLRYDAMTDDLDPASELRDVSARLQRFADIASGKDDDDILELTLTDVFRVAQQNARSYLNAEEEYILSALRLLIERHRWGPRLFNDTTVGFNMQGDEGRFDSAVTVVNDLRVTQRLPYGGEVAARWLWNASENLRSSATGQYRQSSEIVLSADVPLLRGAGMAARESRIQAERNLVYAARDFERFRRSFLVDIANDYFRLLQSKAAISNQKATVRSLGRLLELTRRHVQAGRMRPFQVAIVQDDYLNAWASLLNQRDAYIVQLEQFKIKIGLPVERAVLVRNVAFELSEPDVTMEQALERALQYRLDLQNQRDRIGDARRGLRNARNDLLPDLDVGADIRVPTDDDAREGGLFLDPDESDLGASVTFGLPLDREIERLQLRQSMIDLEQTERSYSLFRDNLIVDVRASVRAIDQARVQLRIAERQVASNLKRQREQIIKEAEVTPQERVDTENQLNRARNNLVRAETDLRLAVLEYLLATAQMRVDPEGAFEPLPGMDVMPLVVFEEVEDLDDWWAMPEYAGDGLDDVAPGEEAELVDEAMGDDVAPDDGNGPGDADGPADLNDPNPNDPIDSNDPDDPG
ncbi:MAG: TolC family protein [Phycisphaerales bacterium]|nr:TolC family protein [Phycisphaerales bacterium]